MTALLCLLVAATLAPPTAAGPAESGVSALADTLATAILRRFAVAEGTIVKVDGTRAFVDVPSLAPGALLEWLVADRELLSPHDLEVVGRVLRPCGRIRVEGSNGSVSWGEATLSDPSCAPLVPGTLARAPLPSIRLGVAPGSAPPELQGLLSILVEVLPLRLERSGLVSAIALGESLSPPGLHTSPAEARAALVRLGLDGVVLLRVGASGPRLGALAEILASTPRSLRDVVEVETRLPPGALHRPAGSRPAAARERASSGLRGTILDLAALPADGAGASVLVLTGSALLEARLEGTSLVLRTLEDLTSLPRATTPTRLPAGTLAVLGNEGDRRVCFGSNLWPTGYCRTDAGLVPVDGVPVALLGRLLLTRYAPGTSTLTGELRNAATGDLEASVGALVALGPDGKGGALLLRLDGSLEALRGELAPRGEDAGRSGDGFAGCGDGGVVRSARRPPGEPDVLTGPAADAPLRPVQGGVARLVRADLDGDGRMELIAAIPGPSPAESRLAVLGE